MLKWSPIDHFTFYHLRAKGLSPSLIMQSISLMAFSQVMSFTSSHGTRNSSPVSKGSLLPDDVMNNDIYFYITLFQFKCIHGIHAKVSPCLPIFKLFLKTLRYL